MEAVLRIDRRILRTKEAIHNAFLELFVEKEFERITINEIADRANVNRATVYLHFLDKYDLLDKCMDNQLNKMLISCKLSKFLHDRLTDPDEMVESLRAVFDYFQEHYLFFSSMLTKQKTSIFREGMLKIIRNTVQKHIDMQGINQSMNQEMIINFIASAFVGTVEWWILNQMPHSSQAMAEQQAELFKRNNIF